MITRILVTTDGSPASNRAVGLAAHMAINHDATLYLLNVIRDMQLPPELKKMAKVENIGQARQDVLDFVAEKVLGDAERRAKRKGVKSLRKATGHGDPANAIASYAQRNKIDLVVMGTRGLGSVKGMLMGSVSRKVANSCDVNLLIVR
ncbi:MAG: universal stress protein [Gammaproteobacteria bacterium]|nr:universal stress protein [Gammaproteobacteria bacterium]NCF81880.1 universal stress protein [Pseudomonadota bacterium]